MSNSVCTRIRFYGEENKLKELLKKVVSDKEYILAVNDRNNDEIMDVAFAVIPRKEGKIDFNILIPQPANIYQGGLNSTTERLYGKENCWWEWRIKHWGTTKNAWNDEIRWLNDTVLELEFHTDWTKPEIWLNTLAEYAMSLGITDIDGEFANEDFGSEMGYIDFNGEWIDDHGRNILHYAECDQDVECYNLVWGEGMAETTGYVLD